MSAQTVAMHLRRSSELTNDLLIAHLAAPERLEMPAVRFLSGLALPVDEREYPTYYASPQLAWESQVTSSPLAVMPHSRRSASRRPSRPRRPTAELLRECWLPQIGQILGPLVTFSPDPCW